MLKKKKSSYYHKMVILTIDSTNFYFLNYLIISYLYRKYFDYLQSFPSLSIFSPTLLHIFMSSFFFSNSSSLNGAIHSVIYQTMDSLPEITHPLGDSQKPSSGTSC